MKRFSLNRRLIIAVVASQVLLATGLILVGTSLSRHYVRSAFDVYLQGRAESIAALVYYRDDGVPGLLFNDAKIPPSPHHIHKDIFVDVVGRRWNFGVEKKQPRDAIVAVINQGSDTLRAPLKI